MTVIKQAAAADALLVSALTIQAARAAGCHPERGFMDRFAESWVEYRDQHPTWFAEHNQVHAALLRAGRLRPLPWPGRSGGGSLQIELLFVREDLTGQGIERALIEAMCAWAAARGLREIVADQHMVTVPDGLGFEPAAGLSRLVLG